MPRPVWRVWPTGTSLLFLSRRPPCEIIKRSRIGPVVMTYKNEARVVKLGPGSKRGSKGTARSPESRFQRVTTIFSLISSSILAAAALWLGWQYQQENHNRDLVRLAEEHRFRCADLAVRIVDEAWSSREPAHKLETISAISQLSGLCSHVGQTLPTYTLTLLGQLGRSENRTVAQAARASQQTILRNNSRAAAIPLENIPTSQLQLSAGYSSLERFLVNASIRQRNFLRSERSASEAANDLQPAEPYVLPSNSLEPGSLR